MNKKCTNPSCRKTFSTLHFYGNCPYCGKEYPQLAKDFWAVSILDYNRNEVRTIIQMIKIVNGFFQIGVKEAKRAVNHIPDTVFILDQNETEQFILRLQELGCTYSRKPVRKKTCSKAVYFITKRRE